MNIQVLAIDYSADKHWRVTLLVNGEELTYFFEQEEIMVGDRAVTGINSDSAFRKRFKLNQHIINRITHLLIQKVNGEELEFPVGIEVFSAESTTEPLLLTE